MWSLFETKKGENKELKPRLFSNGKTQEDVVNEVVKEIKNGHKIIFIKGVCGSGKSAIALNLAKELGKTSIIVPVKALQKQYGEDYTDKKYLMKNGEKLKIEMITGRANHICPYLKENPEEKEEQKKIEKNANLFELDIFEGGKEIALAKINNSFNKYPEDNSCNNLMLPCRIEIKEKNIKYLKKYLEKNPKIKTSGFVNINHIRRMSIAPVCPYWSPIVPSDIDLKVLDDAFCKNYLGLENRKYTLYKRKKGCKYYDQFDSYVDADVIIFNSEKYKLETLMNRKPATEIEIIDECDEFLDSFSNQEKINLNRLNFALGSLYPEDKETLEIINDLIILVNKLLKDTQIQERMNNEEIFNIKDTKILPLLKKFLDTKFMNCVECDDENYCYHIDEVARTFEGLLEDTYVSFYKDDRDLTVKIVTTDLEKRFQELLDKNKVLVLMSGTIHSEKVLKDIFGIKDFKIIEAETKTPGEIKQHKTGYEIDCSYANFIKGKFNRGQYLFALNRCISQAKKPLLIHVNAFKDLPTDEEIEKYNLTIISRQELLNLQTKGNAEKQINKFKKGEIDVLYSTKCGRGADFPGETCNSIILTKYPYPNISSLFWRVLKKTKPQHYNNFYIDKSKREFLQKIFRGLRSQDDMIYLLSPDSRIFKG